MEKFIIYGIVALFVSISISYLNRSASKTAEIEQTGYYLLKMNVLYGIFGLVSLSIGLIFLLFLLFAEEIDSGKMVMIVVVLVIFGGMGMPCVLWYKNHQLKFNQSTIEVVNAYNQTKHVTWKEIDSISFNHFSGFITITDIKGIKIYIHQHLVGLSAFTTMMEAKTNWTVEELKLPIKTKNVA